MSYCCCSIGVGVASAAVGCRDGFGHSIAGAAQAALHRAVCCHSTRKCLRLAMGLSEGCRLCMHPASRSWLDAICHA